MTALEAATHAAPDPETYVQQAVLRSGSSFGMAMQLLPTDRRRALFSVYAFCRAVDDIADGPGSPGGKLAALAAWRSDIDAAYSGNPGHPIAHALVPAIERFHLPRAEFMAMIDGMAWDAASAPIAPSFQELRGYCRKVAGAAGLLSLPIFGADGPEERAFALCLGEALQLTNILRDLYEDAMLGRLYLPAELLSAHGIPLAPAAAMAHSALPLACADLADVVHERFEEARRSAVDCDRARLRPALAMMAVYRRLLDRLRTSRWQKIKSPIRLSRMDKVVAAGRAASLGVLWPRFI